MKNSSRNKTILITGGTGGIGSALVEILSNAGWNIAITGKINSTRLSEVSSMYGISLAFEWDATNRGQMREIALDVYKEYGALDCLVNCVGIANSTPFMEITSESALNEYSINVLGTVFAAQESIPYMLKSSMGGKIINISSLRGMPNLASTRSITYSMTKASIITLTAALAKEFSPKIVVNAIAPGFTLTRMSETWTESTWSSAEEKTLHKRAARPEEIAEHIVFMLSDKCNYMTGQTILVDGGYSIFDK